MWLRVISAYHSVRSYALYISWFNGLAVIKVITLLGALSISLYFLTAKRFMS